MGEAEVGDVVHQVLGEVAVALVLAPGAEVDLVDAHRPGVRVRGATALHPAVVGPLVLRPRHDRARRRRGLRGLGHGVGLGAHDVVGTADLVLVARALADARHEELPDPGLAQQAHRVPDRVPAVEVSDDVHGPGARRPHRERGAAHGAHRAVVLAHVRAEDRPELLVTTLADEVEVDLAQGRREAVRVVLLVLDAVVVGDVHAVVHRAVQAGPDRGPHTVGLVRQVEALAVLEADGHRAGHGTEHPQSQAARLEVLAEQVVGLLVATGGEGLDGTRCVRRRGRGRRCDGCLLGSRLGGARLRGPLAGRCALALGCLSHGCLSHGRRCLSHGCLALGWLSRGCLDRGGLSLRAHRRWCLRRGAGLGLLGAFGERGAHRVAFLASSSSRTTASVGMDSHVGRLRAS